MKNNCLKTQIKKLQNDYCTILKSIEGNLSTDDFPLIIDEINLFWFANRQLVQLILENISNDFNCYIHTGATFLNVGKFEHYPFVLLGNIHIIDDPLYNFCESIKDVDNKAFAKQLKQQIILTVKDNISIIEKYSDIIYIFPVSLLDKSDISLAQKGSENLFCTMFKDEEMTIEKYSQNYNNLEDISDALKDYIKNSLIFSEYDNDENDFINKFRNYLSTEELPFDKNTNEAMIFLYIISGYYIQSFSILLMSAKYQMIPYLRNHISFYYLYLLKDNFSKNKEIQTIFFKMKCAYLAYTVFDINKIKGVDFHNYYSFLQKQQFSNNLFKTIKQNIPNPREAPMLEIKNLLKEEINKLYDYNFN